MKKKTIIIPAIVLILFSLGFLIAQPFRQLRQTARDKTVLSTLRQVAATAQQYFLENEDKEWCSFDALVGPNKYLRTVNVVQGEDYREAFPLRKDFKEISVTTGRGHVITYSFR